MTAETGESASCPACGTPIRKDARFCAACGTAVAPLPDCPACHAAVPPGARFCPSCGIRMVGARPKPEPASPLPVDSVDEEDARAAAQAEIEAARQRRTSSPASGLIANLLLFVALLVAIIVVIRVMNEGAPKEVSPFEGGPPPSTASAPPASAPPAPVDPAQAVRGRVALDGVEAVPGATLFVIARPRGAPDRGPPTAVRRIPNPVFPVEFVLGPGDVMLPNMPFEGPFDLRARLDADGNVMSKAPGDLFTSTPTTARPGDSPVEVRLNARIP